MTLGTDDIMDAVAECAEEWANFEQTGCTHCGAIPPGHTVGDRIPFEWRCEPCEAIACRECRRVVPDHWRIRAGDDWWCGQCFEKDSYARGQADAARFLGRLLTEVADPIKFRMFELDNVARLRGFGAACPLPELSSASQTLLTIEATYGQVVAALGQPNGDETDKSWRGWQVTVSRGGVEVYDYERDYDSPDPATTPDAPATWHINATGPGHEEAAREVSHLIADAVEADVMQRLSRQWACDNEAHGFHCDPRCELG